MPGPMPSRAPYLPFHSNNYLHHNSSNPFYLPLAVYRPQYYQYNYIYNGTMHTRPFIFYCLCPVCYFISLLVTGLTIFFCLDLFLSLCAVDRTSRTMVQVLALYKQVHLCFYKDSWLLSGKAVTQGPNSTCNLVVKCNLTLGPRAMMLSRACTQTRVIDSVCHSVCQAISGSVELVLPPKTNLPMSTFRSRVEERRERRRGRREREGKEKNEVDRQICG